MLGVGLFCLVLAFGVIGYLVVQPSLVRVAPSRLGVAEESTFGSLGERLASVVDRALRRGAWTPVTALELEMAGIGTTVGTFLVTVGGIVFAATVLTTALTGSILLGLLAAGLVAFGAKMVLSVRAEKRRTAFGEQLDGTLQLLASALRAGHSLPGALGTTARESDSPTAEEFGRLINETRIGRDLVVAMHTTADRMRNDDVHWVAEAISVQRETGGNLNEVLDRVGETLRERNALMREVKTLSAEGKASAVVLMVLPVGVALMQQVTNPDDAKLLYTTTGGRIALIVSVALYVVAGLWMRVISRVKI